jgi:hypothetical protein
MESILSALPVVGGLLIIGWLVAPSHERGEHAQAEQERSAEPLHAESESLEER